MKQTEEETAVLWKFKVDRDSRALVQAQIEHYLESVISSGELPVGTRFPTTAELASRWQVNLVTVQDALSQLRAYGLLARKARVGTTVRSQRRELAIAIVAGDLEATDSHYDRALVHALQSALASVDGHGVIFGSCMHHIEGHPPVTPEQRQFLAQLKAQQAIIIVGPKKSAIRLLEAQVKLPLIALNNSAYRFTDIAHNNHAFGSDCVTHLAKLGVKDVTVISPVGHERFAAGVEAATPPNMQIRYRPLGFRAGQDRRQRAIELAQELLTEWQLGCPVPAAMVVTDDVAMAGFAEVLEPVHNDLLSHTHFITMVNEGVDLSYGIPVSRYVFPIAKKAEAAVTLVRERIANAPATETPILISGQFVS